MRKMLTLLVTALTISIASQAQTETGKVSGIIKDGGKKTIESATIMLLNAKDSSVAKLTVANTEGNFQFDGIENGKYLVSVTAVGHSKEYSKVFEITKSDRLISLETIELVPVAKTMEGVVVTSKKPLIEQKIDRTLVNVEAAITNVGSTALEVLEKAPGVTVDKDGNISLKGKQGVQIYIDGRPSYLSGADLANMLRNMSASQLEQLEIMTNPPAKYDAAGNSGIINIKTKKNKQFGFNGSLSSTYTRGRFGRVSESLNLNYRTGKINMFSNLSYYHGHRGEDLYVKRNFRDAVTKDLSSKFDQTSRMENSNDNYSAKIGLDYFASKKTTLGAVVSSYYNPSTWKSNTPTYIYDANDQLQSQTYTFTKNDEKWKNFSGNFNLRHVFDSTGQEITADFDYIAYRSTSDQPLYSTKYDPAGNILEEQTLIGDLPQDITIYSGKVDYTKPLKNGAKFEAGIKTSYVETDNDATYNNIVNSMPELDSARRNHFIYDERINAAYVNYNRSLGKRFSMQLGLRLENTIANGHSTGFAYDAAQSKFVDFDTTFNRNYTQLFPTAYLQYNLNEKNQFVINYGRRINRPDYGDLNPFVHFLDLYTFEKGNPNLKPQFSNNIELTHTYGGFLTTTVNYSSTNDIIQQVLEQNEATNETFIKKANIASREQVGLSVSAFKEITKWWSGNIYANVSYNHFEGIVNNEFVSLDNTVFLTQIQQQFRWGKGWGAELSGFFRTEGVEGVLVIKPLGMMNAGFSKQVLKNKGTLRLTVNDIFATRVPRGYSRYSNVDVQFRNVNDSRSVSLGFTWRFNKGKLKAGSTQRNNSASEEQERVKGGN